MDFAIPDGWTLPGRNIVCCCLNCGFVYYDNAGSQADYDAYYMTRYGYGMDEVGNYIRLDGLAALVAKTFQDRSIQIADFGGGDGYLIRRLTEFGFTHARAWNVEREPQAIVISSSRHTSSSTSMISMG